MIVKHGAGQSLQGLSIVGNFCVMRDITKLRGLLCGCVNSNGILCNQEHPLLNQRGFYVPCHLLTQQGIFVFLATFLSLCSHPFFCASGLVSDNMITFV